MRRPPAAAGRVACLLMLMAACNRDVYLGRDGPTMSGPVPLAGQQAPIQPAAQPVADPEPQPQPEKTQSAMVPVAQPVTQPSAPLTTAPPAVVCEAERDDCDGDPQNGCETDLMTDRLNCGVCGNACQTPDCQCDQGQLKLKCDSGRADCDGRVDNGCEADLMTSMQNCGGCQKTCHANGHDATSAACVSGRCEIQCAPRLSPEADCDGDPDNGCETYLYFDANNCGKCGNSCLRCEGGVCML